MATITLSINDAQGRSSTKQFHLAASVTTIAGAQAAIDDLMPLWPAVSGAGVAEASVSFPLTITPVVAAVGSNLDEAARIQLSMATGVGKENYRMPSPAETAGEFDYIAGGAVDVENLDLVAFFDLFLTGDVFRIGVNSLRAVASIVSGYLEK